MAKRSIEATEETVVNAVKDRIDLDRINEPKGNKIDNFLIAKKVKEKEVIDIKSDDLEVVDNPTPEQLMEFQGRDKKGELVLGKISRLYGYCNKTNVACLLKVGVAKRIEEAKMKNAEA